MASRGWTIAWAILLSLQSVAPVAMVYLLRESVDRVTPLVKNGFASPDLQPALVTIGLLALVMIASELLSRGHAWVQTAQAEHVRDYISGLVHEKATSLDMSFFETPEYYDLLHRVRTDARQRPLTLLENIGMFTKSTITLTGLIVILISYALWLPLVLAVATVPALFVLLRYSRRYNRWRLKNTPNERRSRYYDLLLTERTPAAEMRLFSLSAHYRNAYRTLRTKLRAERLKMDREKMLLDMAVTGFGLIAAGATLLWMGLRVVAGLATLGDLAAFYQIFRQGQKLAQSLSHSAGDVYRSILFLQDLFDFFALQPRIANDESTESKPVPLLQDIRFDNVSLRYPGSESYALKDFSINIPAGKIVAIVGENGMGKTTLTKLLCRLYDPSEGRVLWDGQDLRDMPLGALQREVTMMFQTPYHFHDSARHNIVAGDLAANPSSDQVEAAAIAAGADDLIRRLPQGYETVLGKWFGGEELSVGQWQRVALARAFLRQSSVIVLDEPTSAMDAWAESDWLKRVEDIASNRTLIMITHRFTTAMRADYVYVMHDHRIIEEGSHESLLAQGGRYAQSWREQMGNRQAELVTAAD